MEFFVAFRNFPHGKRASCKGPIGSGDRSDSWPDNNSGGFSRRQLWPYSWGIVIAALPEVGAIQHDLQPDCPAWEWNLFNVAGRYCELGIFVFRFAELESGGERSLLAIIDEDGAKHRVSRELFCDRQCRPADHIRVTLRLFRRFTSHSLEFGLARYLPDYGWIHLYSGRVPLVFLLSAESV